MWARLSAFVIWSLVAATAVFWAMRLSARALQAPAYAVAVGKSAPIRGDLTRLFGAAPIVAAMPESAALEAPSRFKLVGVMAPRSSQEQAVAGHGLALIAIDGKPARAYAVGSRLDSDLVLQSVSMRSASLGPAQGNRSMLLELPALPAPTTGVLPAPGMPATTAAPMRPSTAVPVVAPSGPIATLPQPVMQPQPVPQAPSMQPPGVSPPQVAPDNFRSQ